MAIDAKGETAMVAVAERPVGLPSLPCDSHIGGEASALAVAYLQWASACWRGDERAPLFAARLGAYWHPELPPLPAGAPDAFSPHGGGGRGIHWYETGDEIRGYVLGARGGYRVPIAAVPQLARCITDAGREECPSPAGAAALILSQAILAGKEALMWWQDLLLGIWNGLTAWIVLIVHIAMPSSSPTSSPS